MEIGGRKVRGRFFAALIAVCVLAQVGAAQAGATPAGQLVGAGYDYYGQLGNGKSIESVSHLETLSLWGPTLVTQAAGSDYNTYALLANGTVAAVGRNTKGNDGLGYTSEAIYQPTVIPGLSGV